MDYTFTCTVCKRQFRSENPKEAACEICIMDGSYQAKLDREAEAEHFENRREHLAFLKNSCDDGADPSLYEEDEGLLPYEDDEAERMWDEAYDQEEAEREDNGPTSGSTDLGNPGGTTFCY
jgi:hypothetical protein